MYRIIMFIPIWPCFLAFTGNFGCICFTSVEEVIPNIINNIFWFSYNWFIKFCRVCTIIIASTRPFCIIIITFQYILSGIAIYTFLPWYFYPTFEKNIFHNDPIHLHLTDKTSVKCVVFIVIYNIVRTCRISG